MQFRQLLDIVVVQRIDPCRFVALPTVTLRCQAHTVVADIADRAGKGIRPAGLALFEASQFFVQIEIIQIQLADLPGVVFFGRLFRLRLRLRLRPQLRLRLGRRQGLRFGQGCEHRRGGQGLFSGVITGALLEQLPRCVEHLQAGTASHHPTGHAQLSVTDSETGLAVRALGDETVGHAAVRLKRRLTAATRDAYPAISVCDRVQIKTVSVSCRDFFTLFGQDA